MDINRRGFLKLLGATAATAYVGANGVLAALGEPAFPTREVVAFSIEDDAMVWRADVLVMNLDGSIRAHLGVDGMIEAGYSRDPDLFDAKVRKPAMEKLRQAIAKDHRGYRLKAPPMPKELEGSVERWLDGKAVA